MRQNTIATTLLAAFSALWLSSCDQAATSQKNNDAPVKIGIAHCCKPSDPYPNSVLQSIQAAAKADGRIQLSILNAEDSQETQAVQMQKLLAENVQAILFSPVIGGDNQTYQKNLLDAAKKAGIPVVVYVKMIDTTLFHNDNNVYYVGAGTADSGIQQGEMIARMWGEHPQWDRNQDGVIQYVLLKGTENNFDAETRTRWVQATIENYPGKEIKAQQLALANANWQRGLAKEQMTAWLDDPALGNSIEVIIANSDGMAFGAIDAMQERSMMIPVFGANALPEALPLIRDGKLNGSVSQNAPEQGREALNLAINLAEKQDLTRNTAYKVIDRELSVPNLAVDASNVDQFMQK
ncbi:MAG: substrate-binding domain-containing protein [Neisseria sp.]|nr:substrate-binding domain-containing protein [Neisseria sp.]